MSSQSKVMDNNIFSRFKKDLTEITTHHTIPVRTTPIITTFLFNSHCTTTSLISFSNTVATSAFPAYFEKNTIINFKNSFNTFAEPKKFFHAKYKYKI